MSTYTLVHNKPDEQRKPIKIILLGDSAVGKSKLSERFLIKKYVPVQMSTYALTLLKYDIKIGEEEFDIDIWDTAGQRSFDSMHPAFYHQAVCCILVFDITRKPTYKNLDKWYTELRQYRKNIPCLVACNKVDTDPSVMSKSFAFAEKRNLPIYYVSAADGTNVVSLFNAAIDAAIDYTKKPQDDFVSDVLDLIKE